MNRAGEVLAAQTAIRDGGDTRRMKRELQAGNRYMLAWLQRKGLAWENGAIVRKP